MSGNSKVGPTTLAVAVGCLVVGGLYLHFSDGAMHHVSDGTLVAIKNTQTGKYLSVCSETGMLQAVANSSAKKEARFRMVTLSPYTVRMLVPVKVAAKTQSKKGCSCSGFADEHGFGKYCHNWESEHHRPWCYVHDDCQSAQRGRKLRKHQGCSSEEGYLGPEGYRSPDGCACSGHESVHGFGGSCRGWEFAGQAPWCYVHDNCSLADNVGGQYGAKYATCVSNVSSPPPAPSPPSPPPLTATSTEGWVESAGSGWGTTPACACSGYSNKHGFGAHCKGWEVEGQTPWCYVSANCTMPTRGGHFKHHFIECTPKPGTLRRLSAAEPPQGSAKQGSAKQGGAKQGLHPPHHAHKATPHVRSTATAPVRGKFPVGPVSAKKKKLLAAKPPPKRFDLEQAALLKRAQSLPHVSFISELTHGFVAVDAPPAKSELFVHSHAESLSLPSIFALPHSGNGPIVSIAVGGLLNLCELKREPGEPLGVCTGTPTKLKRHATAAPGKAHEFHRKLLLHPTPSANWVVEVL